TVAAVGDRMQAGRVRADEVALDDVVRTRDPDAGAVVAGDHVAVEDRGAPDGVQCSHHGDRRAEAVGRVRAGRVSVRVGADEIAADVVALPEQHDPAAGPIGGYDVPP